MSPLVSVIVPVYNRENIIKPTIESVIGQTYQDWEMIIVDDGSNDDTIATVESYRENNERIRLIKRSREPKGAPVCRNIGLAEARGEYVIFLDSDDILLHTALEERVREFHLHPHYDFIVFPSAFFLKDLHDVQYWWNRFDNGDDLDRFLLQDVVWCISGPIWKRSFLSEKFLFDENALTSQDWEFHLRVLLAAPNYTKIDSLPDSFIRRDKGYEKISDAHHSSVQVQNRITVILSILDRMLNTSNHKLELLYRSLMMEYTRLMDKHVIFPREMVSKIPANILQQPQNKKIYSYIKFANLLAGINFNLYRFFRKIRYNAIFNSDIYPASRYRSRMTAQEVDAIKKRFAEPVNIIEWRNDPGQKK